MEKIDFFIFLQNANFFTKPFINKNFLDLFNFFITNFFIKVVGVMFFMGTVQQFILQSSYCYSTKCFTVIQKFQQIIAEIMQVRIFEYEMSIVVSFQIQYACDNIKYNLKLLKNVVNIFQQQQKIKQRRNFDSVLLFLLD
eukprot:TRINITY_DN33375_c1_g1_i2.p3 TRINITY_DN33375_c1_g1~~TRINITY_DN33375_c1_g1_i2.p3  ORF type:complete len:140 (+),score=0.10 TRINITY_DN33375_c1_g1_i2:233-652(+)